VSFAIAVGLTAFLASCSHDLVGADEVSLAPSVPQKKAVIRNTAMNEPATQNTKAASAKSQVYEVRLKTVTEVAAYGRGPYICSPSGFGRTSHCVPRTDFK
jgi:hypothetical protein